MVEVATIHY